MRLYDLKRAYPPFVHMGFVEAAVIICQWGTSVLCIVSCCSMEPSVVQI